MTGRAIALVGPVAPYRGGIAQYTTELHRCISRQCRVETVSFARQYPSFLYPGASGAALEEGDALEPGVSYILDAWNPLSCWRAVRTILDARVDFAVMDWWTMFWAPAFAGMALALRKQGVPVLFVCHNLADHGAGKLRRALSERLLSAGSGYLVHTRAHEKELRALFPRSPVLFHPHPTYDRFPPAPDPLPPRGRLELLFFGFIRPYKGLDVLFDALALLGDSSIHLTVVGEPWCDREHLKAMLAKCGAPNVDLVLEYVTDVVAANAFARADLVVLPYRAASGSGVAAVAYRYGKPVLASRVGGLVDVVEDGVSGILVDPGSAQALAAAISRIDRATLAKLAPGVHLFARSFTWESLSQALLHFTPPQSSG